MHSPHLYVYIHNQYINAAHTPTHTHTHTYTHTHTHTHTYTNTNTYIHTQPPIYTHLHTIYIYVSFRSSSGTIPRCHTKIPHIHTHMHTQRYIHILTIHVWDMQVIFWGHPEAPHEEWNTSNPTVTRALDRDFSFTAPVGTLSSSAAATSESGTATGRGGGRGHGTAPIVGGERERGLASLGSVSPRLSLLQRLSGATAAASATSGAASPRSSASGKFVAVWCVFHGRGGGWNMGGVLQHTATHCIALHCTATHCNTRLYMCLGWVHKYGVRMACSCMPASVHLCACFVCVSSVRVLCACVVCACAELTMPFYACTHACMHVHAHTRVCIRMHTRV